MKTTRRQRFEDLPDVLTVAEASAVLRINRNAAYELVHRREIPAFRIGRRMLIPKAGLAQMLGVPTSPETQGGREGARLQMRQDKLTLRGSFVITVHFDGEDSAASQGRTG